MHIFEKIIIAIALVFLIVMVLFMSHVLADYAEPTAKTQVNEQTDLFNKSFDNYDQTNNDFEAIKNQAIEDGKNKSALSSITNKSASELDQESNELNNIPHSDLNKQGNAKMQQDEMVDKIYVDYTRPLNKRLKKDAKKIASAQDELIDNLLGKLKDIGVDCKTVKGDQIIEPEYYMQIEQELIKNTKYNQTFCEELRNQYNCTDDVALHCLKRGMRWNEWEYREVDIAGDSVYHGGGESLGYAIKWKKKRWGWHLASNHSGWRAFLSTHLNIPLDQIQKNISFPLGNRGIGGTHPVHQRWRIVFDQYRIGYHYRDGYEICENWQETWTERCGLQ